MLLTLLVIAGFSAPAPAPCAAPQTPPAPQAAPSLGDVDRLAQAGRFEDAERILAPWAMREPKNLTLWNALGTMRHAQKKYDLAALAFRKALEIAPGEVTVSRNLGVCDFQNQNYVEARAMFETCISADPTDARARMFMARILAADGDVEAADSQFRGASACPSADALVFFYHGMMLFQERRLAEARTALEAALTRDEHLSSAHLNLALVLQRQGETQLAEVHLKRFRALTDVIVGEQQHRTRISELLRAAQREIEAGNFDAALSEALAARKAGPEYAQVHALLAHVYTLKGRPQDAAVAAAEARRIAESHK